MALYMDCVCAIWPLLLRGADVRVTYYVRTAPREEESASLSPVVMFVTLR